MLGGAVMSAGDAGRLALAACGFLNTLTGHLPRNLLGLGVILHGDNAELVFQVSELDVLDYYKVVDGQDTAQDQYLDHGLSADISVEVRSGLRPDPGIFWVYWDRAARAGLS